MYPFSGQVEMPRMSAADGNEILILHDSGKQLDCFRLVHPIAILSKMITEKAFLLALDFAIEYLSSFEKNHSQFKGFFPIYNTTLFQNLFILFYFI